MYLLHIIPYVSVPVFCYRLLKSPEYDTMLQLMISNKTKNRGINGCCRRTSIAVENRGLQTTDLQNLHTVLQFQSTSRFFKDFCVRSYCAESLYFWLDVENYQNLSGGTDYMNRTALKIYHKYIVEDVSYAASGAGHTLTVSLYNAIVVVSMFHTHMTYTVLLCL